VHDFIPGQRWVNYAELQLGLGTVLSVEPRTVTLLFISSGETRTYARQTAPLTRVTFVAGDHIRSHEGWSLRVTAVHEQDGLRGCSPARSTGTGGSNCATRPCSTPAGWYIPTCAALAAGAPA
jgi:ATP-dependent helicase HepA